MESQASTGRAAGTTALREFRAPWIAMRFSCLMAAGWLAVVVAVMISRFMENESPRLQDNLGFVEITGLVVIMGFASICLLLPFILNLLLRAYRVRVDEVGVHYRGLLGWTLWPWEEFESGEVDQGTRMISFVNPKRPFLRRKLHVVFFEDSDDLLSLCFERWRPPEVVVPEVMEIEFSEPMLGRTHLRFSEHGIEVSQGVQGATYGWPDVLEVVIERRTRYHIRFRRMTLRFAEEGGAERTVGIDPWKKRKPNVWNGPDCRVIEAFLRQYVDESRVRVEIEAEGEEKERKVEERRKGGMDKPTLAVMIGLNGSVVGVIGWWFMKVLEFDKNTGMLVGIGLGALAAVVVFLVGRRECQ